MSTTQHEARYLEYLSELKESSITAAQHFLADDATRKDGIRILDCAHRLRTSSNDAYGVQIDTWFCKHPQCPICQSRRALRCCSKMHQLLEQNPELSTGKWLYLTLTVRNCFVEDLRKTIQSMNRAFSRLMSRAFWRNNVLGGIRYTEVVPGKAEEEMAHPHFHCLLLVSPSMHEGKNYISMQRWAQEWQQALQAHYVPMVDCRRLNTVGSDLRSQIVSFTRYSMKPQRVTENRHWFHRTAFETRGLRRFQPFGQIKVLLAALADERTFNSSQEREHLGINSAETIRTWDPWSGSYSSN